MARRQSIGPARYCCALLVLVAACHSVEVAGPRPAYPAADDDYVVVDSRQPTLLWEAFPSADFLDAAANGTAERIADVTYDLRIWRVVGDYPVELVYARSGIVEPRHRLEVALDPGARYHWSVRARFSLGGQSRVGRWGMLVDGFCTGADRTSRVPSLCHYRFATPEE